MTALPNRQHTYKPVYYLQRPESPKNPLGHVQSAKNLSLTMSIGANQSPTNFMPIRKPKQEQVQPSVSETTIYTPSQKCDKLEGEIKVLVRQNLTLKEQNEYLKKEILKLKRQNLTQNVRSTQKYAGTSPDSFNDLRGTIKKESGEIKELKLKLDMVSKQCKMYEEMIDKMDERIKKLLQEQHKRNFQLQEMKVELSKLEQLKEKTNSIMKLYNDLESKFNTDQLEWMKWKQNWLSEKEYYVSIIHQLEGTSDHSFP